MISKISEYSGKYLTDFSAFIRCSSAKKNRPIWQTISYFTVLFPLGAFFVWAFSSTVKSLCGRISPSQGGKNPNADPSSTEHKTNNAFSKTIPLEDGHPSLSEVNQKTKERLLKIEQKERELLQGRKELQVYIKKVEAETAKEIEKNPAFSKAYKDEYLVALRENTHRLLQDPQVQDPICSKNLRKTVAGYLNQCKSAYMANQQDKVTGTYAGTVKAFELLEGYCLKK